MGSCSSKWCGIRHETSLNRGYRVGIQLVRLGCMHVAAHERITIVNGHIRSSCDAPQRIRTEYAFAELDLLAHREDCAKCATI